MAAQLPARDHSPAARAGEVRVRILRGLDELAEISRDWDSLASGAACPMQQYAWFRCAAETFSLDGRLRVVALESAGHVVAIAPLVSQPSVTRYWEMIGARELGEPADFLFADEQALVQLIRALAETRAPLKLGRIPADSRTLSLLRHSYPGPGGVIERVSPGCPRLALDESWREPEQRFDATRRSDLLRARRRAESIGAVRFEVLTPEPEHLERLLEEAYRVEAAGWKGRNQTALAFDPVIGSFFRRFAVAACHKGWLRLAFLRIGGRAAAMQLAVELASGYWLLKIGYDEEYSRCSPGTLLTLESIRHAARHGLQAYEFLGVEEPWTRSWTQSARSCVSARIHPSGLGAVSALAYEGARLTWRRVVRAIRGG